MHFLIAATGALPALAVMAVFDRLDAKRPEPKKTLRMVAAAGLVSVIPCAIVEYLASSQLAWGGVIGAAVRAYMVVALVEELAKAACVRWFVWRRPEFDERMDGIVYGSRAGLGFAMLENVLYLAQAPGAESFAVAYVARALLTVPMHAVCGGLSGYYAARRRFDGAGPGIVGGCTAAVLIHGTYDFGIFEASNRLQQGRAGQAACLLALSALVVIGAGFFLRRKARRALSIDDWAFGKGEG
jgi:protease PrsW